MLVGPVFSRAAATLPRRQAFYLSRAAYVAGLFLLLCTGWLLVTGSQEVRSLGEMARFGATMFQLLAPLQLALALFFSALFTASAVAQEKDRKTLILLLMTDLTNRELVLGRLFASLLSVLTLLAAAAPLFLLVTLLGGVTLAQLARVFGVTLATALVAGSLGSTLALWREKTFQTLALTVLVLVFWLAAGLSMSLGAWGETVGGAPAAAWAAALSPLAILPAAQPTATAASTLGSFDAVQAYLVFAAALSVALNGWAIARVRVWNPSREARARQETGQETIWGAEHDAGRAAAGEAVADARRAAHRSGARVRTVWDAPVLWREMRTLAYGKRMLVIRAAYVVLAALAWLALGSAVGRSGGLPREAAALALGPLAMLSLVLINAQSVTSITTERDLKALDLLLATTLTPREFIFGKLAGALYNTKEMAAAPLVLCFEVWRLGGASAENALYLAGGWGVMIAFVAMLGLHVGLAYENSRHAIGVSLGTVFFLFVGVAVLMRVMTAFAGSFEIQLAPFLAIIVGGSVGLYVALGVRNPSQAIALASLACPFATFWALTSYLALGYTAGVFLAIAGAYGFAAYAMWKPAVSEFDVAVGHSSAADE